MQSLAQSIFVNDLTTAHSLAVATPSSSFRNPIKPEPSSPSEFLLTPGSEFVKAFVFFAQLVLLGTLGAAVTSAQPVHKASLIIGGGTWELNISI